MDEGAQLAEGLRVDVWPRPRATTSTDANDMVLRRLRAAGLLEDEVPVPRQAPAPFKPITMLGEPLSEQIIRERR